MAYNPVPSETIHSTLEESGFTKAQAHNEVVYERECHRLPSLVIRVYTSAAVGSTKVKACGKDAIRVVLLYRAPESGTTYGVKKAKKILRTGTTEAILERMLDRAREMYAFANRMNERGPCPKCGGPRYYDSGSCVAKCWKAQKAS